MGDYIITLTPAQEKALLWDMKSIQEWAENAVYNKARQCTDEIVRQALEDGTHTVLTLDEKRRFQADMSALGIPFTTVKSMPADIKARIVDAARVKSAVERQEELEARDREIMEPDTERSDG